MNQLSLFRDPPALPWRGCMLAERFCPEKTRFPIWVEEKYNGMRALILVDEAGGGTAYSRAGNRLPAAQQIADEVAAAMGPGVVVDGELFAGSWSRTVSAVKRRNPAGLVLHVFDAMTLAEWTSGGSAVSLMGRRERLQNLRKNARKDARAFEVVDGVLVSSLEELQAAFGDVIAAGGEGLMLKAPGSGYTCCRSWAWVKLKEGRPECW